MNGKSRQKTGYDTDADLNRPSDAAQSPIPEAEGHEVQEEAEWLVGLARELYRLKRDRPGARFRYVEQPLSNDEIKEALRAARYRTPAEVAQDRRTVGAVMQRLREIRGDNPESGPEDDREAEK